MPIIQIPFQDPVAPPPPPEKPQPEQLGLYDAGDWETAYRAFDARVPHLLIQLQDDLSRSRRREAAWVSIIVHLILIILAANFTRLEKYLPWHPLVVLQTKDATAGKDVTFLALPPDAQRLQQKSKSNVISDKNRIAMTRHPELDPQELRKSLASPPPGAPAPRGSATQQPSSQSLAQNQPPQMQPGEQGLPQLPNTNPNARLQMPAKPNNNPFGTGSLSAGSAIQEAARASAAKRGGGGGQQGDFGLGSGAHGRQYGAAEILSDTEGVDFAPYLERIRHIVQENWERIIPESAWMGKKGKLAIEFAITKDGQVAGMKLVATSGDTALDRAAWGGITASNPFPPLPGEFGGPYLALRFRFYYNPDKADME